MKDTSSIHKKVQEMVNCYATTDPLKEMSALKNDSDSVDAAVKWIALAALHGVNHNAKEISITHDDDGQVIVMAKYRPTELPTPGQNVGGKIFNKLRGMTHIDADKGETALAIGIRDSSIDLNVKAKKKGGKEKITIFFPKG